MKKFLLLSVPFVLIVALGCSKPAESESSQAGPSEVAGKEGAKTQGMPASQVGVTDAGKNADQSTGSALGGK